MEEKKENFPPLRISLDKEPMSWADMCESSDEDVIAMEVDEPVVKPKETVKTALERMVDEEEPFTMVKRRKRTTASDKRIECIKCGSWFFFTAREQEDYKQKRWCEPKTCLRCRKRRKRQGR